MCLCLSSRSREGVQIAQILLVKEKQAAKDFLCLRIKLIIIYGNRIIYNVIEIIKEG